MTGIVSWFLQQQGRHRSVAVAATSLAGPMSESIMPCDGPDQILPTSAGDCRLAEDAIEAALGWPLSVPALQAAAACVERAVGLVFREHTQALVAVVRALESKGRLDRQDIQALVERTEEVATLRAQMVTGVWTSNLFKKMRAATRKA